MSSLQLEHWFVELGKAAAADAAAIAAAFPLQLPAASSTILVVDTTAPATRIRDFHDESAIAKHREIAIKAMRSATLLALRREDDHIVAERDAEIAARSRGASH